MGFDVALCNAMLNTAGTFRWTHTVVSPLWWWLYGSELHLILLFTFNTNKFGHLRDVANWDAVRPWTFTASKWMPDLTNRSVISSTTSSICESGVRLVWSCTKVIQWFDHLKKTRRMNMDTHSAGQCVQRRISVTVHFKHWRTTVQQQLHRIDTGKPNQRRGTSLERRLSSWKL